MKTSKKVAYTVVMGGLTSIACSGCIWQYQRYQQSKERWRVITEEVDNYNPQELSNIPCLFERELDNIKDWQYRLVKVRGEFYPDMEVLVNRVKDGRMGYQLVRPFRQEGDAFNILVNCGWLPKGLEDNVPPLPQELKTGEIIGLVKRDENIEIKRTSKMYPKTDEFFNLVDLDQLGDHFGLSFEGSKGAFLDLIKNAETEGELGEAEEELYPVTPTNRNFSKPYLTPRRHMEYCTFWGLTATIGFLSIVKVLRF